MLSCLVYQKFTFNELSRRKITNGEIQPPFMTFNVSCVIAKNHSKLVQPVELRQVKQIWNVKNLSNVQNRVKFMFKKHTVILKMCPYLSVRRSINSQRLVKDRMFSITCNTLQFINHFSPQLVALCLTNVDISVRLSPVFEFPVARQYSYPYVVVSD